MDTSMGYQRSAVPIDGGEVDSFQVCIGGKILGPYNSRELRKLPGFFLRTPTRPMGSEEWSPAFSVINIKRYFNPSQPLVVPTWSQIVEETVTQPIQTLMTPIFRWLKRILLIGLLCAVSWAGIQLSRQGGSPAMALASSKRMIVRYFIAQGHRGITCAINSLHDIDVVWFSETPAPAPKPITPAVPGTIAAPVESATAAAAHISMPRPPVHPLHERHPRHRHP